MTIPDNDVAGLSEASLCQGDWNTTACESGASSPLFPRPANVPWLQSRGKAGRRPELGIAMSDSRCMGRGRVRTNFEGEAMFKP